MFGAILVSTATLHNLALLSALMPSSECAFLDRVYAPLFNTLIQNLAPEWVRARVMAAYLFVFQGSVTVGSTLWGVLAQHSGARLALLVFSARGIAAVILLAIPFSAAQSDR